MRLWFAREDDVIWLRGDPDADWLRNLRAHPECIVRMGSDERRARYEAVTGDRNVALRHVVKLWRAKYGPEWVQDWWHERGREPVRLHLERA